MKLALAYIVAIFVICIFESTTVSGEEKKEKAKKLQIGIKKRVDNCKVKSRKGDLLHMHYTVSFVLAFYVSYVHYYTVKLGIH